ncbi:MAG TPA: DinB family protein, partial [Acidimicrobiia bacterium]|nr:DinB family protein [Acidimicrobiia bacterium]
MDRTASLAKFRSGYAAVEAAISAVPADALDSSSGPGEWTPRMVIHHLADSEATAFVRLRRLIAEDDPVIVGYDEAEFARRLHYDRPVSASLAVLAAVRAASLEL